MEAKCKPGCPLPFDVCTGCQLAQVEEALESVRQLCRFYEEIIPKLNPDPELMAEIVRERTRINCMEVGK